MSASVDIQKHEKGSSGHVEYFIKVIYKGKIWAIRKRYSDFIKLDKVLRKGRGISVTGTLPSKEWWIKSKNSSKLSSRQNELQKYLQALLKDNSLADHSLVKEFLEVDFNILELTKKLTSQQFFSMEKTRMVIQQFQKDVIPYAIVKRPSRYQFSQSGKHKLNRSRSTTSISLSTSSISNPSARISKDSQHREHSPSFELISGNSNVSSLRSLSFYRSPISQKMNSNSTHADSSSDGMEPFSSNVKKNWIDFEEDISQLLDSFESIAVCSLENVFNSSTSFHSDDEAINHQAISLMDANDMDKLGVCDNKSHNNILTPCEKKSSSSNILAILSREPSPNEFQQHFTEYGESFIFSPNSHNNKKYNRTKMGSHQFLHNPQIQNGIVSKENFNTVLEGDNSLLKDMESSHFTYSIAARKNPLINPYSKIISIHTNLETNSADTNF